MYASITDQRNYHVLVIVIYDENCWTAVFCDCTHLALIRSGSRRF